MYAVQKDKLFQSLLEKALTQGKFQICYQPVVQLHDQRIVGAEALLRLPGKGIDIEHLIRRAEETGMIDAVTGYVIRRVIEDWPSFHKARENFRININISAQEIASHSICEQLLRDASDIPSQALAFEITERQFASLDVIVGGLYELRGLGYRIYLDDFGTGFSNMTRLLKLPLDGFKLDGTFLEAPNGFSAINAMYGLAKELGVEMVVEGVETQAQKDHLRTMTPDILAQGWLFGRPMRRSELVRALQMN